MKVKLLIENLLYAVLSVEIGSIESDYAITAFVLHVVKPDTREQCFIFDKLKGAVAIVSQNEGSRLELCEIKNGDRFVTVKFRKYWPLSYLYEDFISSFKGSGVDVAVIPD